MICCSASWMFTSLPNSVGLLALPLRMISVLGSKMLTSFPSTRVPPPSTRALVCCITCWRRGSMTCAPPCSGPRSTWIPYRRPRGYRVEHSVEHSTVTRDHGAEPEHEGLDDPDRSCAGGRHSRSRWDAEISVVGGALLPCPVRPVDPHGRRTGDEEAARGRPCAIASAGGSRPCPGHVHEEGPRDRSARAGRRHRHAGLAAYSAVRRRSGDRGRATSDGNAGDDAAGSR